MGKGNEDDSGCRTSVQESTQRKARWTWGRGERGVHRWKKELATQLTCHTDVEIPKVIKESMPKFEQIGEAMHMYLQITRRLVSMI
jgi:hypothetical protein